MQIFNGFKAIVIASIVAPMAFMNVSAIAMDLENEVLHVAKGLSPQDYKEDFSKKREQLAIGWTALSALTFAGKKAFNANSFVRAAKVCGGISWIAAIPVLTSLGLLANAGMVYLPAKKLADYKLRKLRKEISSTAMDLENEVLHVAKGLSPQDYKEDFSKKREQLADGWTALSALTFAGKKAFNANSFVRAAKVCGGISLIAAIPVLTSLGLLANAGMVILPAEKLADYKLQKLRKEISSAE
jgi:hypothetical protein